MEKNVYIQKVLFIINKNLLIIKYNLLYKG